MTEEIILCAKPGCHRPRQVIQKVSIYSKSKMKYMKTCCRHGVNDIPIIKPETTKGP